MAQVVFDVETVGQDFDLLDETAKDYFLRFAKTDEEREEARNSLSFYPLTAQIVTIAMLEVETGKGFVFYQNGGGAPEKFSEGEATFVSGSEKELLENFWKLIGKYNQFITFNGRVFDCPFVMLRSAMNHIRTSKNLMPYRYNATPHIDLADQLSFYEALRRRFSLHMWCQAFNVKSPKQDGVTGLAVKDMYKEGRYQDIARYCLEDVRATKELYQYWEKYLKF